MSFSARAGRVSVHGYPPTSKTLVTPEQTYDRKKRSGCALRSASVFSYGCVFLTSSASGRPSAQPVCEKWTCASTRPGMIHVPFTSSTSTPSGTRQAARGPAQSIFPARTRTTASGTGGAPVPSTSVAPTNARGGGGVPGGASNADVTVTFHPFGVFTKSRSERPKCSSEP